jgi:senataxin
MIPHPGQSISELLTNLRESPIDTESHHSEDILKVVYDYLNSKTTNVKNIHWFCGKTEPTVKEAATFLLRLFAYDSPDANLWRDNLNSCVNSCRGCAAGFEQAKRASVNTYVDYHIVYFTVFYMHFSYFGNFEESVRTEFFSFVEKWELQCVLDKLCEAKILSKPTYSVANKSFTSSPTLAYRIITNLGVMLDIRILTAIMAVPPTSAFKEWEDAPVPSGLLVLLLNKEDRVRSWAKGQLADSRINMEHFHPMILPIISGALTIHSSPLASSDGSASASVQQDHSGYPLTKDAATLSSQLAEVLKRIPRKLLISSPNQPVDLRRLILSRLHDTGEGMLGNDCGCALN